MPFTLLHLGPGLAVGLPLRKHIHAPTFMVASVLVDVEPFVVLVFGLGYSLHGYLHTFIGALVLGVASGYFMYLLEGVFNPLWRKLLLASPPPHGLRAFITAGAFGTLLHVLMDSPLYSDIRPLYPAGVNPFYNPALTPVIYYACMLMGILGLIYYLLIALKSAGNSKSSPINTPLLI